MAVQTLPVFGCSESRVPEVPDVLATGLPAVIGDPTLTSVRIVGVAPWSGLPLSVAGKCAASSTSTALSSFRFPSFVSAGECASLVGDEASGFNVYYIQPFLVSYHQIRILQFVCNFNCRFCNDSVGSSQFMR
ncbi:succinate flavoprotein subunit [Lasius niger]|uniref:Succinate flavoprotein subunit n=1 Tax=Lasius niger TaxID=67767 RepID=A0A0J7K141_LASNI|nr:succinate flavoprotein subunit [Lasius niger]